MRRGVPAAFLTLVVATVLTACGSTPAARIGDDKAGTNGDYVAIGDSYTSAPGVGSTVGNDGCFQSTGNYPRLVAAKLGLHLTDRSCAGAGTVSVTGRQITLLRKWVDPQIDAVTARTKIITVGLGANDFALYNFISTICPKEAEDDPDGQPCTDADRSAPAGTDVASKLQTVQSRLVADLRTLHKRAPKARVLVIGYPDLVPTKTCSAFPLAAGDIPFARGLISGLNEAAAGAAAQAHVTYVNVYAATHGHDICSSDPWIAGKIPRSEGVSWHPHAKEQQKVAELVEQALDRTATSTASTGTAS